MKSGKESLDKLYPNIDLDHYQSQTGGSLGQILHLQKMSTNYVPNFLANTANGS